jgi:hypothetical protein
LRNSPWVFCFFSLCPFWLYLLVVKRNIDIAQHLRLGFEGCFRHRAGEALGHPNPRWLRTRQVPTLLLLLGRTILHSSSRKVSLRSRFAGSVYRKRPVPIFVPWDAPFSARAAGRKCQARRATASSAGGNAELDKTEPRRAQLASRKLTRVSTTGCRINDKCRRRNPR